MSPTEMLITTRPELPSRPGLGHSRPRPGSSRPGLSKSRPGPSKSRTRPPNFGLEGPQGRGQASRPNIPGALWGHPFITSPVIFLGYFGSFPHYHKTSPNLGPLPVGHVTRPRTTPGQKFSKTPRSLCIVGRYKKTQKPCPSPAAT